MSNQEQAAAKSKRAPKLYAVMPSNEDSDTGIPLIIEAATAQEMKEKLKSQPIPVALFRGRSIPVTQKTETAFRISN